MQGPMRAPGHGGKPERLRDERLIRVLEAENRELRRQLAALRHGMGISVVIDGHAIALAVPAATDPHAPAVPSATRPEATPEATPEAARHPRTAWQAGARTEDTPTVSAPAVLAAAGRSGYAFERQRSGAGAPLPNLSPARRGALDGSGASRSPAGPGEAIFAPHAVPVPWPGPSLPSMPTSLLPVPPPLAPSHRVPERRAPRLGAADDSWLTDQHPVPPVRSGSQPYPVPRVPDGTRPQPASQLVEDDTAWLRTGTAWPDTTPSHSVPPPPPGFPPPASPTQRPVRAPRTNRQDLASGARD